MRDQLHQKIEIGDDVIFNPPQYKGVVLGKVTKLTPKSAGINYGDGGKKYCTRDKRYVLKITEQIKIAKEQNPEYFI